MDCKEDPNYNLSTAVWLHRKLMVKERQTYAVHLSANYYNYAPTMCQPIQHDTFRITPNMKLYVQSINVCQEKDAQNLPV